MALQPILQVRENATLEEVRTAYKKAALRYHPDKGGNEEDFKQLHNEYELLIEGNKKPKATRDPRADFKAGIFSAPVTETVKEEKNIEVVKNKYNVKFLPESTQNDRISSIFGLLFNNKFSTSKEPADLFAGAKKVGQISYVGRFVEIVKSKLDSKKERVSSNSLNESNQPVLRLKR